MSDDSFRVDLNELDAATARVAGFIGFLSDSLAGLEQRMGALQQNWQGQTAVAQAQAFEQWRTGATDVVEGIDAMRQASIDAHGRYSSAVEANLRMLGRR
ncbi:WXG100 family type VII secretion target [Nocardia harenae]|uniref:WXG100 family type VII secretion target n=1 Tax=Nocardia harenae TaxID=358707 RepID=UPI000A452FC6|nr:WXG100 family type VII secretion target [Nocardia harenae]